jgi:hypothetical protein
MFQTFQIKILLIYYSIKMDSLMIIISIIKSFENSYIKLDILGESPWVSLYKSVNLLNL